MKFFTKKFINITRNQIDKINDSTYEINFASSGSYAKFIGLDTN
jgi:hypothetical protein